MKQTMAKTYFKLAHYSDKILRRMENEKVAKVLEKVLNSQRRSKNELAR